MPALLVNVHDNKMCVCALVYVSVCVCLHYSVFVSACISPRSCMYSCLCVGMYVYA